MERGRGTQLTDFGASLVQLDAAARVALEAVHAPWQRRLEELLAPVVRAVPERLRLAASHDLALADWVEHGRRIRFDLFWRGSDEALAELGRDECDVAGFHVPESWTPAQMSNWLARWLKPGAACLPAADAPLPGPDRGARQSARCRRWPMLQNAACAWSIASAARARAA
jgi:putative molybdopterin biosynthesis protein